MLSSYIRQAQAHDCTAAASTTNKINSALKQSVSKKSFTAEPVTAPPVKTPAEKTPFVPTSNLSIVNNKVIVTLPVRTPGQLWDTWEVKKMEFTNDKEGFAKLVKLLVQLKVDIDNRVIDCTNAIEAIQSITSYAGGTLEIVETAVAAAAFDSSYYPLIQTILSTISGAGGIILKYASIHATEKRNDAYAFQNDVNELTSAEFKLTNTSAPSVKTAKTMPNDSKDEETATSQAEPKEKIIQVQDISVTGGTFKNTPTVRVNDAKIEIMRPVKINGVICDTWEVKAEEIDNNEDAYTDLFSTLSSNNAELDNRINKYDQAVHSIQSITSMNLALLALAKIAVTANLGSSTSNQIFQITSSATASVISLATKFFSNKASAIRDNAIGFRNDNTTLMNSQYKP